MVELALVKLFDAIEVEELVSTMATLLATSNASETTPSKGTPSATPPIRGSITVGLTPFPVCMHTAHVPQPLKTTPTSNGDSTNVSLNV